MSIYTTLHQFVAAADIHCTWFALFSTHQNISIIGASLSEHHTSVVNAEFLCIYILSRWPWYVRPPLTQVSYVSFPCYKSRYSSSGFLRLVPSMLQAACTCIQRRDCRLRRRRERERKSAVPQKQEGCLSKRRESDGAGAVSQSAYTGCSSSPAYTILLGCFNRSDYVDSTY